MIFEITLGHYLILSSMMFIIGLGGVFINAKNLIRIIMSIELMLVSIIMNFAVFSMYMGNILGQIFCLVILCFGAAEVCIGLAIIVAYYKRKNSLNIEQMNEIKG